MTLCVQKLPFCLALYYGVVYEVTKFHSDKVNFHAPAPCSAQIGRLTLLLIPGLSWVTSR